MATRFGIVIIFSLFAATLSAQTPISYGYDLSGNRYLRKIVQLKSAIIDTSQSPQVENSQSSSKETNEKFGEELGKFKIEIYPNPTRGELRVEITGFDPSVESSLRVYNLSGAQVAIQKPLSTTNVIDFSHWPSGTYIVKIELGSKVSEWKIMKE
jgi:hypothetical protein